MTNKDLDLLRTYKSDTAIEDVQPFYNNVKIVADNIEDIKTLSTVDLQNITIEIQNDIDYIDTTISNFATTKNSYIDDITNLANNEKNDIATLSNNEKNDIATLSNNEQNTISTLGSNERSSIEDFTNTKTNEINTYVENVSKPALDNYIHGEGVYTESQLKESISETGWNFVQQEENTLHGIKQFDTLDSVITHGKTIAVSSRYYNQQIEIQFFNIDTLIRFNTVSLPYSSTLHIKDMNSTHFFVSDTGYDTPSTDTGIVYAYNISDGSLAYTFNNPNEWNTNDYDSFGISLFADDTYIVIDSSDGQYSSGHFSVYSASDFSYLGYVTTQALHRYYNKMFVRGDKLIILSDIVVNTNDAYVSIFDLSNLSLICSFKSPNDTNIHDGKFSDIVLSDTKAFISCVDSPSGMKDGILIYNISDGSYSSRILNANKHLAQYIASNSQYLFCTARDESDNNIQWVYQYDLETLKLEDIISDLGHLTGIEANEKYVYPFDIWRDEFYSYKLSRKIKAEEIYTSNDFLRDFPPSIMVNITSSQYTGDNTNNLYTNDDKIYLYGLKENWTWSYEFVCNSNFKTGTGKTATIPLIENSVVYEDVVVKYYDERGIQKATLRLPFNSFFVDIYGDYFTASYDNTTKIISISGLENTSRLFYIYGTDENSDWTEIPINSDLSVDNSIDNQVILISVDHMGNKSTKVVSIV